MEWNIGSILFPFYLGEVKKENIRSLLLKLIDIRGSDSRKKNRRWIILVVKIYVIFYNDNNKSRMM